jgi:hypothetical protein
VIFPDKKVLITGWSLSIDGGATAGSLIEFTQETTT